MTPEEFQSLPTPRCDASARKSSATPTIYTQWMPVDDGRKLERELAVCERVLQHYADRPLAGSTLRLLAEMRKEKT